MAWYRSSDSNSITWTWKRRHNFVWETILYYYYFSLRRAAWPWSSTCIFIVALLQQVTYWDHIRKLWGRVTYICVSKLTIMGSDNGLSPGRRQAIIWTNAGILLIRPWGTNFSEILIGIQAFSFKKKHLKMSSAKWRPFCLGLNVLKLYARWRSPNPST